MELGASLFVGPPTACCHKARAVGAAVGPGAGGMAYCSLAAGDAVEALRRLRGLSDEARIGLTWVEGTEPPAGLLRELGAEYWNPMFGLVTPAGVEAVHDQGRKVSTWTVDRSEDMGRVVQAGVDAVVSNRIGDLLVFLGRG